MITLFVCSVLVLLLGSGEGDGKAPAKRQVPDSKEDKMWTGAEFGLTDEQYGDYKAEMAEKAKEFKKELEDKKINKTAQRKKKIKKEKTKDAESDIGSDFSGRRKNHKFKTISGDGRPLGDREMLLKKKKASDQDLSSTGRTDLDEELGSGLFDRFSKARTTLTRSSVRKKKDEDSVSLGGMPREDSSSKVN